MASVPDCIRASQVITDVSEQLGLPEQLVEQAKSRLRDEIILTVADLRLMGEADWCSLNLPPDLVAQVRSLIMPMTTPRAPGSVTTASPAPSDAMSMSPPKEATPTVRASSSVPNLPLPTATTTPLRPQSPSARFTVPEIGNARRRSETGSSGSAILPSESKGSLLSRVSSIGKQIRSASLSGSSSPGRAPPLTPAARLPSRPDLTMITGSPRRFTFPGTIRGLSFFPGFCLDIVLLLEQFDGACQLLLVNSAGNVAQTFPTVLHDARDLAITPQREMLVLDVQGDKCNVLRLDGDGKLLHSFASKLKAPAALALCPCSHNIAVLDMANGRIEVCNSEGFQIRCAASKAVLSSPTCMTFDSRGNLLVADREGLRTFTSEGPAPAQACCPATQQQLAPSSMLFEGEGRLLLCDRQNSQLHVFYPETGKFLHKFSSPELKAPTHVKMREDGVVYVAGGHRILVF